MYTDSVNRKFLLPAIIGAALSLFLLRTGVLAFFFLVPLGFVSYRYDHKTAWTAFLFAALGNFVLAAGARATGAVSLTDTIWEIVYYGLMAFIFTGIVAPPPALSAKYKETVRFFCGSCLGALLFIYLFLQMSSSPAFLDYIDYLLNVVFQVNRSSGTDVVQNALLGNISAELVLETALAIMLRGGSLVSCIILFAVSRQISLFLARLSFRKQIPSEAAPLPQASSLASFRVNSTVIWVFSGSLLLVVLTGMARLEILEIILWNILVLCVILYFTQGLGILQFFFARFALSPFLKLFLVVLLVVVLLSPFLNLLLLGGLFLLGVAENWAPLRAQKKNGPPSTPEAGDGEDEGSGEN
jgi:hypothetical protein